MTQWVVPPPVAPASSYQWLVCVLVALPAIQLPATVPGTAVKGHSLASGLSLLCTRALAPGFAQS